MPSFLLKGVEFRNPKLTRSLHIWSQYLCWCIQCAMGNHRPYYPPFIRRWAFRHYGQRRMSFAWHMLKHYQAVTPEFVPDVKPPPWWLGEHALGPLIAPWGCIQKWFRSRTGGRSHRSEFTDRQRGALYGGMEGAFMEDYFERLIENIDKGNHAL